MSNLIKGEIKGKFEGLNYIVEAYPDDCSPDFDYGDAESNYKEMQRFESGELLNLTIIVRVYDQSGHVSGDDLLGQCFVRSENLFDDIKEVMKDNGMLEQAKQDLDGILSQIIELNGAQNV